MNDRELLELAAKAAGINLAWYDDEFSGVPEEVVEIDGAMGTIPWNPRVSDGDALRLAVKLKIDISFFEGYQQVLASSHCCEHEAFIDYTEDRGKDVRLAIVTAAASIGEAMP